MSNYTNLNTYFLFLRFLKIFFSYICVFRKNYVNILSNFKYIFKYINIFSNFLLRNYLLKLFIMYSYNIRFDHIYDLQYIFVHHILLWQRINSCIRVYLYERKKRSRPDQTPLSHEHYLYGRTHTQLPIHVT